MIDLRNDVNKKETPENKNSNKIIDIAEKTLNFYNQQKSKERPSNLATRLKIWTSKKILQRLPIALAQVIAGNKSGNLLNKIKEMIYPQYQAK